MNVPLAISTLFEPMIVLVAVAIFGGWKAGLRDRLFIYYCVYIVGFSLVIGLVRAISAKHTKTNWDISDRKKRIVPLVVLMTIFLGNMRIVRMWGNSELMLLHAFWFVWVIGFLLLTIRIKISGHLSVLTMAIGLMYRWVGNGAVLLFLCIPLVSWSRIRLKRHTFPEVLGGILYAVVLLLALNSVPG